MSKKSNKKKEKNLFHKITYTGAVLILLCCIALLLFNARRRSRLYEEEVERVAAGETEYIITEREDESESETAPAETEAPVETAAAETEAPTETENPMINKAMLVLNGTRRPGVAGNWKTILEQNGYTNVSTATYTGAVAPQTAVYLQNMEQAEALKGLFPNATFQVGALTEGIEANPGETLPAQFDLYIVIGSNDAEAPAPTSETAQTESASGTETNSAGTNG